MNDNSVEFTWRGKSFEELTRTELLELLDYLSTNMPIFDELSRLQIEREELTNKH
jgi:hypothetical protein